MALAHAPGPLPSSADATSGWIAAVRQGLRAGTLAPYLGPGVMAQGAPSVPTDEATLARFLESKQALPKRARGNLWAAAQYIESQRHRNTLVAWLAEAFAPAVEPTPFQRYLATLPLPLIVDTWYDGAMRTALAKRRDWGEVQGASRAKIGEARWTRTYDVDGRATDDPDVAAQWTTLLYKPHGSIVPERNFLVADSDYVETLTEIDIQSPIPAEVIRRRAAVGFVFLGCRFHDQMLRTYARQIAKRSNGPHFVLVSPELATRNELKLVKDLGASLLVAPLAEVLGRLTEEEG